MYVAGQRIFGRCVGLIAALLLFISPLAWFFSEVAYAYAVQLPFAVLATWLLYEMWFNRRHALLAAVVIGIGAGFRQDILLFFGPFFVVASVRLGMKRMLASLLTLALSLVIWLIPFMLAIGDIAKYNRASGIQSQYVIKDAVWVAGLAGLMKNADGLSTGLLLLLGASAVLVPPLVLLFFTGNARRDGRIWFLLALCAWPLLFYLMTFFHWSAYILVIAPGAFLLFAYAVAKWVEIGGRRWSIRVSSLAAAVILGAVTVINLTAFFDIGALSPKLHEKLGSNSRGAIQKVDTETESLIDIVRKSDPDTTLVVFVGQGNDPVYFRQANYYLPEYRQVWLRPESGAAYHDYWMSTGRQHRGEDLRISLLGQEQALVIGQADVPGEQLPAIGPGIPVTLVRIPAGGSLTIGPYTIMP